MHVMFDRTKDFLIERVKRDAHYTTQSSHFHPYFEIGYVMYGTRSMTINHSLYHLVRGNLVFITKGELHKGLPVENAPSSVELINLYFKEDYLIPYYEIFGKKEIYRLFETHVIAIPNVRQEYVEELFQKMLYEHEGVDELSKELIHDYVNELICFLIRYQKKNQKEIIGNEGEHPLIQEAVKYIYYNYSKELSLELVAKRFNLSKSYFSKRFKAVTGFGFKEYLVSVRLKEACNLLLNTDKTITEIAFLCGFNDSNYFGDAFRKANGISPHNFRKYHGFV